MRADRDGPRPARSSAVRGTGLESVLVLDGSEQCGLPGVDARAAGRDRSAAREPGRARGLGAVTAAERGGDDDDHGHHGGLSRAAGSERLPAVGRRIPAIRPDRQSGAHRHAMPGHRGLAAVHAEGQAARVRSAVVDDPALRLPGVRVHPHRARRQLR
ncbi:hypothetical protein SDC9_194390 [bioreactor metagenome]|uniref:Uncharacterized protein n=1 Tax=bioreactor metagenome TaxID=1076179 RepID=A0A645I658_9ZZZZ